MNHTDYDAYWGCKCFDNIHDNRAVWYVLLYRFDVDPAFNNMTALLLAESIRGIPTEIEGTNDDPWWYVLDALGLRRSTRLREQFDVHDACAIAHIVNTVGGEDVEPFDVLVLCGVRPILRAMRNYKGNSENWEEGIVTEVLRKRYTPKTARLRMLRTRLEQRLLGRVVVKGVPLRSAV